MVSAEPGIRLSKLFRRTGEGVSRDDIYALIATRELYVDLGTAPLAEPERVHVFANGEAAVACGHIVQQAEATTDNCRESSVRAGHTIAWDGRTWTIANPGEKTISLLGEDGALSELPVSVFEELTKQRRIQGPSAQQ
jgi:putative transposase